MKNEKVRILLVEDEESIREGICDVLTYHGFAATGVGTGEDGLKRALTGEFALVILDVMLPRMNGFDVCQSLREKIPTQPILMLTAKGSEDDVVEGFKRGADDYVTKPFSIRELVLRVKALLRRAGRQDDSERTFSFGRWRVDGATLRAQAGKRVLDLTQRELALLALFAREKGRIVSRRSLLQEVWGMVNVDDVQTRTVDMHIAKLRKKVDTDGESTIETIRGAGYRFNG
jgi:DNA-binding response OmpR family regulator